jgi:hypothetical protein
MDSSIRRPESHRSQPGAGHACPGSGCIGALSCPAVVLNNARAYQEAYAPLMLSSRPLSYFAFLDTDSLSANIRVEFINVSNFGCSPHLPQALTFLLATTSSCLYGGWGFVSQSFLVLPYSIGTHTINTLHWHHRNTGLT